MSDARDVIIYELNEVPWQIVDLYAARRPDSTFVSIVKGSRCLTTVDDDPAHLQPWRTWPTFHTGLYAADHGSMELGQDPDTFRGETVWDAAQKAGKSVGLFGVLQSWPARTPRHGGFWVPDTFARTPEAVPAGLSRFQSFNLSMTAENTFSASAPLNAKRMAAVGVDLFVRGLKPGSAAKLGRQVLRERKDARWKAARPMVQALPAFDLYWRLHKRMRPNLSMFFTNHVAGMMHRFWGDAVPGYAEEHGYEADEIFGNFVFDALDIFDEQLGRIQSYIRRNPRTVLIIASSMGQAAIPYAHVKDSYVVRDAAKLSATLGLPANDVGLAMYPRYALEFASHEEARAASERLASVHIDGKPMFTALEVDGRTVSAAIRPYRGRVGVVISVDGEERESSLDELGINVEERLGGGNTAYHIPQGIWIAYGEGIDADSTRAEFSALEAKARILDLLGVTEAAPSAAEPVQAGA